MRAPMVGELQHMCMRTRMNKCVHAQNINTYGSKKTKPEKHIWKQQQQQFVKTKTIKTKHGKKRNRKNKQEKNMDKIEIGS